MSENNGTQLKTGALGMSDCIMIAIGGMVGSAIFTLSGLTYLLAGAASVVSWIVAGIILLLYALNVAELSTTFPKSGGLFVFPYELLGKTKTQKSFWGWLSAWSWLCVIVIGVSFSSIFVANYLGALVPALADKQIPVAIVWILICWGLNVLGTTFMGKINLVLTISLIVLCLIYAFVGLGSFNAANFEGMFSQGTLGTKGFAGAIPIAMLAYGSIIAIASIAEEIRDPQKTIPKAMGISVFATIAMYSLMIIATTGLVNWNLFPGNDFATYAPLTFAVVTSLPDKMWLAPIISIGALLAITTTMLVMLMDAGRTIMVTAKSGFFPKIFTKVNPKTQTPINSLTFAAAVAIVLACFPQFCMNIVNIGAITSAVTVTIVTISLISLRKKGIETPGAFKVPGGLILPIITLIVLAYMFTQQEANVYMWSLGAYAIGFIIYGIAYTVNKGKLDMHA